MDHGTYTVTAYVDDDGERALTVIRIDEHGVEHDLFGQGGHPPRTVPELTDEIRHFIGDLWSAQQALDLIAAAETLFGRGADARAMHLQHLHCLVCGVPAVTLARQPAVPVVQYTTDGRFVPPDEDDDYSQGLYSLCPTSCFEQRDPECWHAVGPDGRVTAFTRQSVLLDQLEALHTVPQGDGAQRHNNAMRWPSVLGSDGAFELPVSEACRALHAMVFAAANRDGRRAGDDTELRSAVVAQGHAVLRLLNQNVGRIDRRIVDDWVRRVCAVAGIDLDDEAP